MPYSNISAVMTPAQKAAIKTAFDTIKANIPTLVNLSKEERKKLRKVGGRIGYVKDVVDGCKANPSAIASTISITELEKDATYFSDMSEIYALGKPLFEAIEDTMTAVGSESIRTADQGYKNLKANANGNANVKATVEKISTHFKKQSRGKTTKA